MTQAIFAVCVLLLTAALAWAYRRWWRRLRGPDMTPTGFGGFLGLALFAGATVAGAHSDILIALSILAVGAAIYWLDDWRELDPKLRMILSFTTGAALCWALLAGITAWPLWKFLFVCTAAGMTNVVLTNIVNFSDGRDLNLATFIVLTAATLLLFSPLSGGIAGAAIGSIAFIVPFAVMNSKPRTIYLGDAGSFAFASFLTFLAVLFFRGQGEVDPRAAIPLALPAFDTAYVFLVRVSHKHDLLSHHNLHLYQKLHGRYRGFAYLAPQLANLVLSLLVTALLVRVGLPLFWAVFTGASVVTIVFFFLCRKLYLPGDVPSEEIA